MLLTIPAAPARRLVLATDLDGTFLGGDDADRHALYRWIETHRQRITLIFVTGRDLPFIRALVQDNPVPRPDYVIGDVGTTVAGGAAIEPIAALEADIAQRWGNVQETAMRVRALLADAPGLRLQDTPFRHRQSYYYEPALLAPETLQKIQNAGFDSLLSADTFLDVLPRGVSKGPTLLRLLKHLNIAHDDVLVAGDTLNDLSLFETGLTSVVVGNAEPALRARVAMLPRVYQSPLPGAAGILDAVRHHGFADIASHASKGISS